MKKIMLLMSILLMLCVTVSAQSKKEKANKTLESFHYEIECAGVGSQGTALVKVWSFSDTPDISKEQCEKNAVHGIIFKGYSGKENGCVAQRALINTPGAEYEHSDYFRLFFADGGEYAKYVTVTNLARDVVKVGKQYKIGMTISVQKDALRKALETGGVLKSLDSGF